MESESSYFIFSTLIADQGSHIKNPTCIWFCIQVGLPKTEKQKCIAIQHEHTKNKTTRTIYNQSIIYNQRVIYNLDIESGWILLGSLAILNFTEILYCLIFSFEIVYCKIILGSSHLLEFLWNEVYRKLYELWITSF